MGFKAIGRNISHPEGYNTIEDMAKVVTDQNIEVIDLCSYEVKNDPDDILFIYGQSALRACEALRCLYKLEFPDIDELVHSTGDIEEKEAAYEKLLHFKELLDSGNLTELDKIETQKTGNSSNKLDESSLEDLAKLEAELEDSGETVWRAKLPDGRTLLIAEQPEYDADVNMTFAELKAVRSLVESFRIKELEIVYKPNTASRKGSPR